MQQPVDWVHLAQLSVRRDDVGLNAAVRPQPGGEREGKKKKSARQIVRPQNKANIVVPLKLIQHQMISESKPINYQWLMSWW
jgi:hypothetical protein